MKGSLGRRLSTSTHAHTQPTAKTRRLFTCCSKVRLPWLVRLPRTLPPTLWRGTVGASDPPAGPPPPCPAAQPPAVAADTQSSSEGRCSEACDSSWPPVTKSSERSPTKPLRTKRGGCYTAHVYHLHGSNAAPKTLQLVDVIDEWLTTTPPEVAADAENPGRSPTKLLCRAKRSCDARSYIARSHVR